MLLDNDDAVFLSYTEIMIKKKIRIEKEIKDYAGAYLNHSL